MAVDAEPETVVSPVRVAPAAGWLRQTLTAYKPPAGPLVWQLGAAAAMDGNAAIAKATRAPRQNARGIRSDSCDMCSFRRGMQIGGGRWSGRAPHSATVPFCQVREPCPPTYLAAEEDQPRSKSLRMVGAVATPPMNGRPSTGLIVGFGMKALSQSSPLETGQSCMSWHLFGVMEVKRAVTR